jgi:hypothetical protein
MRTMIVLLNVSPSTCHAWHPGSLTKVEYGNSRQPVDRRSRRHVERAGLCRPRSERYRTRAVEALGAHKEWPLVGGETEEVSLEREPARDVRGAEVRHAVAQVACIVDEDPHRPAPKCDATSDGSSELAAPRRRTACACHSREVQGTHEPGRLRRCCSLAV